MELEFLLRAAGNALRNVNVATQALDPPSYYGMSGKCGESASAIVGGGVECGWGVRYCCEVYRKSVWEKFRPLS